MNRTPLPSRRGHITHKVSIGGRQRTLYLSVDEDAQPHEIFLRIKGQGCTAELVSLYDTLAKLMSLALQYDVPLSKIGEMLIGTKCAPSGPVGGHARIKFCNSQQDFIGRHLLLTHCHREDLAHVTKKEEAT